MSHTHHVIRTLTFEVHIPSEEQGFIIQETISDLFNSLLQRELEKLLDKLDNRSEVISIDKMEIDLGFIEESTLAQELPVKIKEYLEEKLMETITSARMNSAGEVQAGNNNTAVSFKPANKSKLDLLLHFLQTGSMPWWAKNEERSVSVLVVKLLEESPTELKEALEKVFRNEAYMKRFVYQLPDPLITEVMKLYDRSFSNFAAGTVNDICTIHSRNSFTSLSSQTLRLRCWSYFIKQAFEKNTGSRVTEKADHLRTLITLLQPAGEAILFVIRKARQMQDEQMLRTPDLADLLVIAKKQAANKHNERAGKGKKARRAKKNQKAEESKRNKNINENGEDVKAPATNEKKRTEFTRDDDEWQNDENKNIESSKKKKPRKAYTSKKEKNDVEDTRSGNSENLNAKEQREKESPKEIKEPRENDNVRAEIEDQVKKQADKELLREQLKKTFSIEDHEDISDVLADGIYINNAGLVLVWPYMLAFFRKLELVAGNEFRSEEAQHRGVHILQYLATGEETASEEHELVLNKLLCGVDPEEPVSAFTSLTTAERNECELLLDNIIDNWDALKKISTSSLRTTFLVKEGILKRDNGWSLKIDRTTVDMLIDHLPWGISIIKLPWNNEMIHVEW